MTELILKPKTSVASGEMMGEHQKAFSCFQEALDYLRDHPFGTIEHPDMDMLAFIYIKNDGSFAFVDVKHRTYGKNLRTEKFIDSLLSDDDLKAFEDPKIWDQSKFVYLDGTEMACRIDGIAWFDDLRADLSLSSSPGLPRF
ncbi:hypothetical protein [Rhizobium sp. MHM7A]|uniref:hypothetical protein n=1 Tax=Rhizobium sp. MHM7A TaxID=2583233 RepID=UPI001105A38F|nr:hypothetical protein [Rhizobium sp. MHM7A]TLX16935.1 hypothetical protein FFR93_06195 [Rhizobium sp. MHM7A]